MAKAPVQQTEKQQMTVRQERELMVHNFSLMLDALEGDVKEVLAKGGDAAKLRRIAIIAVQKNPDLLECSRDSWITAIMHCAQDGLLPDGREAAFVKFAKVVQYMPMVYGIRKKMLQSGEIRDIFTAVVYQAEFEAELFEVVLGSEPKIMHKPLLGNLDRGPIIAAYSVATFKDGTKSFEVMTSADIAKVRAVSKASRDDSPWKTWEGEMSRKTVLRRHSKSLPMSSDIRDVEVETMFDPAEFARRIAPSPDDIGVGGGPARGSQLGAGSTADKLDALEDRAFGGADVDIDAGKQGLVDGGELVDVQTGEVTHRGNKEQVAQVDDKPPAEGEGKPAEEERKPAEKAKKAESAATEASKEDDEQVRMRDAIGKEYRGAANIIDLRARRNEHEATIDAMSEENAGVLAKVFQECEAKLKGGR